MVVRPAIVRARWALASVEFWATVMTFFQYSSCLAASLVQSTSTLLMSTPAAFQTSMKYFPTSCILARSPPILLLTQANQSAIQSFILTPAFCMSSTRMGRRTPKGRWASPLGSNPS